MANCSFPNCTRHAEKNGYCVGHRIYAKGSGTSPDKAEDPKDGAKKKDPGESKTKPASSRAGSGSTKKS